MAGYGMVPVQSSSVNHFQVLQKGKRREVWRYCIDVQELSDLLDCLEHSKFFYLYSNTVMVTITEMNKKWETIRNNTLEYIFPLETTDRYNRHVEPTQKNSKFYFLFI